MIWSSPRIRTSRSIPARWRLRAKFHARRRPRRWGSRGAAGKFGRPHRSLFDQWPCAAFARGLGARPWLWRRQDHALSQVRFARAGGIEALSNTLSEDTAIAMELARQGLKTVFSHRTIAQETGARSFAEIYNRQLRWSVIRRKNERFTFPLEPLASPLPAAFAGRLLLPSWRGRPGSASLRHCFMVLRRDCFASPRAGRCRPGRRWRFSAVKSWRSRRGCVPSPPMMSSGKNPFRRAQGGTR